MMTFQDIKLEVIEAGRDVLLLITGGEAHIGATSTAYWHDGQCQVETIAIPHHKEHTLTESIAERAANQLQCTVSVVMGIHYDNLNKAQILQISDRVEELFQQFLQSYNH
ncbi:hypothetical protein J2Z32_000532 [Paenibacillus turicensis]|uniref:Prenylated flavin chaperone LpdD-like domain-containing protein n=1 Tax=Paenibacillus turicensis TaxID=160487 RepID=A0ABS4FMW2_9BACL|nr:hypothetical protein [Paenibacillus turicensis]MBP1903915.1 hypothetical protein [Paenibacillus turicensis]